MSDDSITRKLKDITAGFVGGAAQVLIGQPFDLVKVRIQTGQYKTPLEAFTKTLATEGPLAFYRGTSGPLLELERVYRFNSTLSTRPSGSFCAWMVRSPTMSSI